MQSKYRKKTLESDDIPVASFADIAFLLIIFFLVTMSLQETAGFQTDIPAGETEQKKQEKTPSISLHKQQIRFNDDPVTISQLKTNLKKLDLKSKTGDQKIILMNATDNVPYQNYFETMSIISAAGGTVAIVREDEETKK
jgi:biopolymer transport protein ExbD